MKLTLIAKRPKRRASLLYTVPHPDADDREITPYFTIAPSGTYHDSGPFLAGYLFDRTGDYHAAFAVSALAIIGSAVAVWIAGPRNAHAFREPVTH